MQLDGMIGANGGYVKSEGKVILHQSLSKAEVKPHRLLSGSQQRDVH